MQSINKNLFLSYLMLAVAVSLSVIAAYYSIVGLAAIFAAAVIPIVVMGSILEIAKVTVTVWLHEYWRDCRWLMKTYLTVAVVVLMVITSMGIFGFLSKAHLDQAVISGDSVTRIAIYDEKIKAARENIDTNRRALKQMDEAVEQQMARSTDEQGAQRAANLRRNQQGERTRLQAEIAKEQGKIQQLSEERAPVAAEVRKVEAEVGPIKYIAALIYGDNPDANLLEKAVRWVIILIVFVFDPLAIMMLLAATESMSWIKRDDREHADHMRDEYDFSAARPNPWVSTQPPVADVVPGPTEAAPQPEPVSEPAAEPIKAEPVYVDWKLDGATVEPQPQPLTESSPPPDPAEDPLVAEREAMRAWKSAHPETTIKEQRRLLDKGLIKWLPWKRKPQADNEPISGEVRGFGVEWPRDARKGDQFLRVDAMPSKLFKYNGSKWIEVDKRLSDQYAFDTAYIDHLINKIDSGEYDAELLSDAEREQIRERLTQSRTE